MLDCIIFTTVTVKNTVFWFVMPYSPLEMYRCFGGIYRLPTQGWKISQARNQQKQSASRAELVASAGLQTQLYVHTYLNVKVVSSIIWVLRRNKPTEEVIELHSNIIASYICFVCRCISIFRRNDAALSLPLQYNYGLSVLSETMELQCSGDKENFRS